MFGAVKRFGTTENFTDEYCTDMHESRLVGPDIAKPTADLADPALLLFYGIVDRQDFGVAR